MKMIFVRCAIALSLGCGFLWGDDLPDHELSEWSLGETLFGSEEKLDDLKGRVVVIEYWGTR